MLRQVVLAVRGRFWPRVFNILLCSQAGLFYLARALETQSRGDKDYQVVRAHDNH